MEKILIILLLMLGITLYANALTHNHSNDFTVTTIALDAQNINIEEFQDEEFQNEEAIDINETRNIFYLEENLN
jgi:hypothetical protein